jgi:antitoxin MazE
MKLRIRKWGDRLTLSIPASLADEAGLAPNSLVDLSLDEGTLVVRRVDRGPWMLDELLEGVNQQNLHGEHDTGPAVGGEVW